MTEESISTNLKTPPYSLDAEESVLGSCLIDPEAVYKLDLTPEMFYREKNRWTWEAILALKLRNTATDQITVAQELAREAKLEAAGGAAYLSHLVYQVPTSVHVEYYANIVRNLYEGRKLISASNKIAAIGYEHPEDMLERSEDILRRLRDGEEDADVIYHDDALVQYDKLLEQSQKDAANPKRLWSGWRSLDRVLRIRNGTVTMIAGYSSWGKTIIAEHLGEMAAKLGLQSAYFLYELSMKNLMDRRTCRYIKLGDLAPDFQDVEDGKYREHRAYFEAATSWMEWAGKFHFVPCTGWSANKLAAKIRTMSLNGNADVVIVDYLQCIPTIDYGRKGLNAAQIIGEIVLTLKEACLRLPNQPPLILLSQLSREGEIRNSGEPEEYSNAVIYINNQWKLTEGKCANDCSKRNAKIITLPSGRKDCLQGCIELKIGKNTFGATGRVPLRHDVRRFKFYEESDEYGS